MRRALQLARLGSGHVAPNPMVGAVIVHDGKIIGEGYHRRYGGPHAEVNAIALVRLEDVPLLGDSTMYVTLEPCSHFGKTPPCADLILSTGIPRVVVGCLDPFEQVSGRGVERLRAAGVEVEVGVESKACEKLNEAFMTAHRLRRPFITLKWAQTADGYLAAKSDNGPVPLEISTPVSIAAVHALRSRRQAILVGSGTVLADKPNLGTKGFSGNDPVKVIVDRRGRCSCGDFCNMTGRIILFTSRDSCEAVAGKVEGIHCDAGISIEAVMKELYSKGITSVLVEGGAEILRSCIGSGLWDEARVEISPRTAGAAGAVAVSLPEQAPETREVIDGNRIFYYRNRH